MWSGVPVFLDLRNELGGVFNFPSRGIGCVGFFSLHMRLYFLVMCQVLGFSLWEVLELHIPSSHRP